jgi:hypothetical protein
LNVASAKLHNVGKKQAKSNDMDEHAGEILALTPGSLSDAAELDPQLMCTC